MQILDNYMDDPRIEITFETGLTNMHIDELLYFKDMSLPTYLKLFYQQSNGVLIESGYFKDELDDATHFYLNPLADLSFTTKKLNQLPDARFIRFASNEEDVLVLLDTKNLDPNGNPIILVNLPAYNFCIPLTNSFENLLECACNGLFGIIQHFALSEGKKIPPIPAKMKKWKDRILPCLKDFFLTSKREYDLLDIWHLSVKGKKIVQTSTANWFKGLKILLTDFK